MSSMRLSLVALDRFLCSSSAFCVFPRGAMWGWSCPQGFSLEAQDAHLRPSWWHRALPMVPRGHPGGPPGTELQIQIFVAPYLGDPGASPKAPRTLKDP